jgi:hypothetical protein
MKKSILNECLRLARKGLPKHPEYLNYPHWTFLIVNNQIASVGVNSSKEPNKALGYHSRIDKDDFVPKWHSEIDALTKTHRCLRNGFSAINVRVNKSGDPRMSMPCSVCQNLLLKFGCDKICFTHINGWGYLTF